MKRILCLLLITAFVLSLFGCSSSAFDPVVFYYCRQSDAYQYFEKDGVIASEERDLTGHSGDLRYLIALYLAGPLDEGLVSPFPRTTRLVETEIRSNRVYIELTEVDHSMTDVEFSLAAACLAKTCIRFTDCRDVTVKSGVRTVTISEANIVLFDSAIPDPTEGE